MVSVTSGFKNHTVVKPNVKVILHVKVVKWTLAVVGVTTEAGQDGENVTKVPLKVTKMVHAKKMVGFGSIVLNVTVLDTQNANQMVPV